MGRAQGGYLGINVMGWGGGGVQRMFRGLNFSTPVIFWV